MIKNNENEILVVEDTVASLKLLTDILISAGYKVRPASDGELALRSVSAKLPSLILLDIRMPGIDGYEVCRRLKADERTKNVPVIFLSSLSDIVDKVTGFELGAIDYITKPFQREELLARVKTHINLYALQNYLESLVEERTSELMRSKEVISELNQSLEKKIEEELAKNREKDYLLIQQSRLAAMGEMIHNIAHQWRQPLNALSILLSNIKDDFEYKELTADSLAQDIGKAKQLLQKMSSTIDDFRDFFRPDKEANEFEVHKSIEDALTIMEAALKNNHIEVTTSLAHGITVHGFKNQLAQTILNIVANAKEIIAEKKVPNGRIEIYADKADDNAVITITDNGGGIPEDVLPKIFDPYFSTKYTGSGIGLYMSKIIIEHNFKGAINAENGENGARLTIVIPLWRE